jgi:hypothetical protein
MAAWSTGTLNETEDAREPTALMEQRIRFDRAMIVLTESSEQLVPSVALRT